MAFHEVRFPANLSFGSVGGPERRTEIVSLASGAEERNTPWAHSRRHYDAGVGMRSLDDIADLISFFEARKGELHGFRWKDWSDFRSCKPSEAVGFEDHVIAVGDGVTKTFQLAKAYVSGPERYLRPITKPVVGTVRVGLQGSEVTETVHYDLDVTTGLVTFVHAPELDVQITAGFEFDVPVRFATPRIETSVSSFQAGDIPSVPVVEIRV